MARRTATTYRSGRTTAAGSKEPAEGDAGGETGSGTEAQPEDAGLGLAEALSIATTVILVAALLMLDAFLGKRYGKGIFFG